MHDGQLYLVALGVLQGIGKRLVVEIVLGAGRDHEDAGRIVSLLGVVAGGLDRGDNRRTRLRDTTGAELGDRAGGVRAWTEVQVGAIAHLYARVDRRGVVPQRDLFVLLAKTLGGIGRSARHWIEVWCQRVGSIQKQKRVR